MKTKKALRKLRHAVALIDAIHHVAGLSAAAEGSPGCVTIIELADAALEELSAVKRRLKRRAEWAEPAQETRPRTNPVS